MGMGCFLAGCAADTADGPDGLGSGTLVGQQLDQGISFELAASSCQLSADFHGGWIDDGEVVRELPVRTGFAYLATDDRGRLSLEQLDLELEDLVAGEGLIPPAGIHLTDLHVSLAREVATEAEWADHDASAEGSLDLSWEWSMQTENRVMPLGEQRIRDLPFDVHVAYAEADRLDLVLDVAREGIAWDLPGVIEVRNLEMHLEGVSATQQ
ncbi:MAG: hypothetical protein JRI23_34010 [Deltaproteobacteria bacterium]|nr:hypothetical protein [Deltaproteobacteria bacterium]MBW2537308.1 hypothetical protein [Deltaproteobacteria bacterium]